MQYAPAAAMNQRLRPNGNAQRDLTCQVDFGQHIVYEVAAKMLENRFTNKGMHGIIPFGFGKFQIMFASHYHVDLAVKEGMAFSGTNLKFDQIERRFVTVTIRNCPLEISPDVVREHLNQWGEVLSHEYEMDSKRGWYKGPRRLKMKMRENVPNIFKIGNYTVIATYAGVQLLCKRCQSSQHLVSECEEHFCFKCRNYGHRTKDCVKNRRDNNEQEKEKSTLEETTVEEAPTEEAINKIIDSAFPPLILEQMENLNHEEVNKELENDEVIREENIQGVLDVNEKFIGEFIREMELSSESESEVSVGKTPRKDKKEEKDKKTISPVKKDSSFSSVVQRNSESGKDMFKASTPKKIPDTILGEFDTSFNKKKTKRKKGTNIRNLFPSPKEKEEEAQLIDTRRKN